MGILHTVGLSSIVAGIGAIGATFLDLGGVREGLDAFISEHGDFGEAIADMFDNVPDTALPTDEFINRLAELDPDYAEQVSDVLDSYDRLGGVFEKETPGINDFLAKTVYRFPDVPEGLGERIAADDQLETTFNHFKGQVGGLVSELPEVAESVRENITSPFGAGASVGALAGGTVGAGIATWQDRVAASMGGQAHARG